MLAGSPTHLPSILTRGSTLSVLAALACALGTVNAEETAPEPDTLTGGWAHRLKLEETGLTPHATLTSEAWANVAGGLGHGAWYNHLLDFGLSADTEKLGGWSGGGFFLQFHWALNSERDGSFADHTGALNPVSGIMAADHLRIFNFYYQHTWGDHATLKIGQLAVDDDFMLSSYSGLFANSAFGAMPSQVGNRLGSCCGFSPPYPIYPVAAPGLFIALRPAASLSLQAGAYHGTPGHDERDNYGFDWANQSNPQIGVFVEAGYEYTLAGREAALKLGANFHSGRVEEFSPWSDSEDDTRRAVPGFYAVHDLELVRSAEGETQLGLFTRAGFTPDDGVSIDFYADAGLNWFGPIPGRSADIAGVALSYTHFGDEFRRANGGALQGSETTLELAYQAQVNRWLALQADVQLLFNPAPRSTGERETATVLGLRATLNF